MIVEFAYSHTNSNWLFPSSPLKDNRLMMIDVKDLNVNCVLADRIQLSASTVYITELLPDGFCNVEGKDNESYVESVLSAYLKDKKNFNVVYDRVKRQYYIRVPEDYYIKKYPFISNVRLRLNNPFTVTFEFNFNRYIRYFAKSYKGFNSDYDKSIRIADDNYINKQVWKDWDNNLVKQLPEYISDVSFEFASFIMGLYVPDFDLDYKVLTINQIEFAKDYFVGCHKSADVLHDLMYFVISSSGVEWINKLSGFAISVYNADKDNSDGLRYYGDQFSPTLKFPVGKGIFFKIYRKSTDHIRFELTYHKDFINKQKKYVDKPLDSSGKPLRFYGFLPVYNHLRVIAKEFIKRSDFKDIIVRSVENNYSDYFAVVDNLYKFIERTYPELPAIADAAAHLNPVSDNDLIHFIRSNKRLSGLFVNKYNSYGRKQLVYNPEEARSIRREKIIVDDERKRFIEDLWRKYKHSFPDDKIYVLKGCKGFSHHS